MGLTDYKLNDSLTVKELETFLTNVRAVGGTDDTRVKVETKGGTVKNIRKVSTWNPSGFPHLITD